MQRCWSPLRVWGHVNMAVVPKNYYSRLDAAFCAAATAATAATATSTASVDLSTPKRTTYFSPPLCFFFFPLTYFSLNLQQYKKILKLQKNYPTNWRQMVLTNELYMRSHTHARTCTRIPMCDLHLIVYF